MALPRFSLPPITPEQASGASLERELSQARADAWHNKVTDAFAEFPSSDFPQLYNPTEIDIPADAQPAEPTWAAFPARLAKGNVPDEVRWRLADEKRSEQDEYCEWSITKDPATEKLMRVIFTCELPEYFDQVAEDEGLLVAIYQKFVDDSVAPDELQLPNGKYKRANQWNDSSTDGNIMHLIQTNNKLSAAVALVAEATIVRERNGVPVTDRATLFECSSAALGDPDRNSDPQIAERINKLAREHKRVTFADPVGLYIDELVEAGIEFPGGLGLADCWHIERGDPDHILRARFELPDGQPIEDVNINGRPVTRGAQIADRVMVRITALADAVGTTQPLVRQCGE